MQNLITMLPTFEYNFILRVFKFTQKLEQIKSLSLKQDAFYNFYFYSLSALERDAFNILISLHYISNNRNLKHFCKSVAKKKKIIL